LRPARIFAALKDASPIKAEIIGDNLDILVVRELTGGIYFGERGRCEKDGVKAAYDTEMYTVEEIRRIAKVGFEMASKSVAANCVRWTRPMCIESPVCGGKRLSTLRWVYPEVELSIFMWTTAPCN
jgi:3-isopropylmalate dehydrogenase